MDVMPNPVRYTVESNKDQLAIWWLSPTEMSAIGHRLGKSVPDYIKSEYVGLLGRHPRGRLWVHNSIALSEIKWADNAIGEWCTNCGGIVIWRKNIDVISRYPGLITDTDMKRLSVYANEALLQSQNARLRAALKEIMELPGVELDHAPTIARLALADIET